MFYDYMDEDYADEKPFVRIRNNNRREEGFMEKPSKIEKKKRKMAQRSKEFRDYGVGDEEGR